MRDKVDSGVVDGEVLGALRGLGVHGLEGDVALGGEGLDHTPAALWSITFLLQARLWPRSCLLGSWCVNIGQSAPRSVQLQHVDGNGRL